MLINFEFMQNTNVHMNMMVHQFCTSEYNTCIWSIFGSKKQTRIKIKATGQIKIRCRCINKRLMATSMVEYQSTSAMMNLGKQ